MNEQPRVESQNKNSDESPVKVPGDASDAFLDDLIQKVVYGFVSSLQNDSPDMWHSFNEVLQIIQPYSSLIEGNAQLMHYVERTYHYFCEKPECGLDINALAFAFPQQVSKLQASSSSMSSQKVKFPSTTQDVEDVVPEKKFREKKGVSVPKGAVIPTASEIFDDDVAKMKCVFPTKDLNINDLRKSLPFVVYEIGLREASWGRPLGITATVLNTDLAEMLPGVVSPRKSGSDLRDDVSSTSKKSLQDKKDISEEKVVKRPLTGREIVERFVKGHFLKSTKFAYLNRAESKHYDPYDLTVVPRKKIKPEHFVVSSHAILHVIPNHPSELVPLNEWYKEALLFSATRKFNFFKNFLIAKMFLRWKRVKKVSQFRALCENVSKSMVTCTPGFGSALLRIYSLVVDLDQVQLLPFNDQRCKPLPDFNDITIKLLNDAQECLQLFYSYCLSVINKSKENCFEYLEYCKEQLGRKTRNPGGESISVAKERKAIKLHNMKLAHDEIFQLDRFIKLVEQILITKLLTLARQNVCRFVNDVLDCEIIKDHGLFNVALEFDKTDKLVLNPGCVMLQGSLYFALESVLKILCQSSDVLDNGLKGEVEDNVEREDSLDTSSERTDSKRATSKSPNMLQNFLVSQSPVNQSALGSSVPGVSLYDRSIHNTPFSRAFYSPGDTKNEQTAAFKSLVEESLGQKSLGLPEKEQEQRSESAEPCVEVPGGLLVEGKTMQLQVRAMTSPVSKKKLEEIVFKDEEILQAVHKEEEIVNNAIAEVVDFCSRHEWVMEVQKFVRTWNKTILTSWRGRPTETIEKQLTQIKTWIERMKKFTVSFCTTNGLLMVDCSGIRDSIIPKLDTIFRQLTKMIAKDLLGMTKDFSSEMNKLMEQLTFKSYDLKAFAGFIALHKATKEKVPALQVKVDYIKSLFEMVRNSQRQLTREEEIAEDTTWSSWENFLLALQEASDYLLVKTPRLLGDLEEKIMSLEYQARVIGEKASKGEYLIPENTPTLILTQLRQLRQRFRSVMNQLDQLIKCREVICSREHDKSELLAILKNLDVRYELWKYYDVSDKTIRDWLHMSFRKMNVKKVTEKVGEWQLAANHLKPSLPNDDQVHESWVNRIGSFMKDFPLLQLLSNDALKLRHWKALFVGMGQQYDPEWKFTIADLYSFKLSLHKELISSICSSAVKENALELQLRSLAKKWTEKDFKLAKHFARTRTPTESKPNSSLGRNSSRKSGRNQTSVVDMYILAGDEELKCLIEDNRVTLQLMLVSPYVADLKQTVEGWMKNLEQLEEILDLWVACQRKWLYLSGVFGESNGIYEDTLLCRFQEIDRRFKEFMYSVGQDSKVLSVLAKKRGEKGYRELQGEALRSMLFSLLKEEGEVLKSVSYKMEKIREAFPRLYFLSDEEVLDVIINSNNPRKLIPVVRKCFHGIRGIKFSFPDQGAKPNTAFDAALNSHLLEVSAIEGEFGETVALGEVIPPGIDSQTWLKVLEKSMKTTLMENFTKCLISSWSRTEDETLVSDFLMKGRRENALSDQVQDASTTGAFNQKEELPFLLRYPSQCIRCVEAVVWSSKVCNALACENRNDLKALGLFTSRQVEGYGNLLSVKESANLKTVPRLRPLLQSLLICALYQRDVVERLLASSAVCSHSFEWQSCLHHEASLKKVFETKYCTGLLEKDNTPTMPGTTMPDNIPLDVKYEFAEYNVTILGSKFPYGFEYLSEHASLLISPLTERCFLTLSLAMDQYSCGTAIGVNGSGKTETIKELAKLMGRPLVFYNCSQSMASSVVKRMLTGMILSGSWVCFEDAHKLSQSMLSILGDYLSTVRQAYQCLLMNKNSQYKVRGQTKDASKEPSNKKRRNSVTTLDSLSPQELVSKSVEIEAHEDSVKKSAVISRRFSVCEGRNINVRRYYGNTLPLPVSVPGGEHQPSSDNRDVSDKEDGDMILIKQRGDHSLGSIVFDGCLLKTHSMAGCFMTVTPDHDGHLNLPDNLKASLRTVSMTKPNVNKLLEVLLLCNGFSDVKNLAEKIVFFFQVILNELPSEHHIGANILKTAVVLAGNKLQNDQYHTDTSKNDESEPKEISDQPDQEEMRSIASSVSLLEEFENRTKEESAIVYGLFSVLCPKLDEESKKLVCARIDTIFTHTVLTSATQTDAECVAEAVREQLIAESMQPSMDLVSKVIQLYQVLQMNHAVIILGLSGTGKTTIYKTLCKAINSLNTKCASRFSEKSDSKAAEKPKYPKVNLTVLFPRAMSESELFGRIDPVTYSWTDGILVKCARSAQAVKNASEALATKSKQEQAREATARGGYHQWIVLDGPLDHGCVDQMNSLLDDGRSLSLASGEIVPFSEAINFLLEVDDLQNAAPAVVSRCGIVYCPDGIVGWKNIFKSWLKGAHATWNISLRGLGIISSLMDHCVETTLTFLSDHCTRILYANYNDNQTCLGSARGVYEIQRMLTILSSLFDKYVLRDNDETLDMLDHLKNQEYSKSCSSSETGSGRSSSIPAHDANTVVSSFAYAYIWAFGGDLHESCLKAFDEFSKALLSSGPHPHTSLPPVAVFDYHLDFPTGTLLSSTEKLSGKPRVIGSSYVVVPRDEVYFSLLDILLSANKSVVLVGRPGCGKSSFMQNLVNSRYKYVRLSLAHGVSTQLLQEAIESKVQGSSRRESVGNNLKMSSQTTRNVFFLDDMNMAATDGTNNQPSAELVRSLISLGGLYDRQRLCLKPLSNTCIVGAAVPPCCPGVGGSVSSFSISPRLARITTVLAFHALSTATLQSIYCNLFQTWLEDFPAYSLTHHRQLAKAISSSTMSLFEKISQDLRPTPVHPHYVFTQHDMARVFQGMMLLSSKTRPRAKSMKKTPLTENNMQKSSDETGGITDQRDDVARKDKSWPVEVKKDTLVSISSKTPALATPLIRVILRLWCHECSRVFSDRFTDKDELWFSSTLRSVALEHFCKTSLDSPEEGTGVVVFQRAATPKTPEASPAASSSHSGEDDNNDTNIKTSETTEHVDDTIEGPAGDPPPGGEQSDNTGLPVPAGDDVRDSGSPESHLDISQNNEQKAESESGITDESSVDEFDFVPEEEPEPRTTLSKQRVVTFEDMSKRNAYCGPLINSDQLIDTDEDLSKIIFCRHFTSSVRQGGPEQERGYSETTVTGLTQGLKNAQKLYNQQDVLPLDLVFFETAVRHAARLSRSLCLTSGNVLLLSKSGHGRKELVLLSSFAAGYKLIQLKRNKNEDSRQRMKSAVYVAGLQGKQVVLYVPQNVDHKTMQDVCSLMSEGNCPGLYSSNELATIYNELIPSSLRGRRNDNMYVAQERFFRRVRTNLHVIVCLNYPSDQFSTLQKFPFSRFSEFPSLLTRTCCIDVFQPWHGSSLVQVSALRLADQHVVAAVQQIIDTCKSSVTAIMSYVHTSAVKMLERQFGFNQYKCYTPKTFVEFVDVFAKCCDLIWKEEQDKIVRCEQALAKIKEANEQIDEMQRDLDNLIPILRTAEREVKDCLQVVEGLQADYSEGREKCKQQETEIENMTAPIAELERLAKIELDKVNPVFRSAYDALRALNVYDVEEIRSYRTPPRQVVLVVNAVCLLFGKEETWEEGKLLFSREDFIKDLEFFNMKAISDKTFRRLKEYVENLEFFPEEVKEGSRAAMSVCVWIRAVYHFCVVYRDYFPKQQRVIEAKKILDEAVAYLGDLRVRCNEIKAEVEAKIEDYKEKVHNARSIEKQIQMTEQRKSRAKALIRSMSNHIRSWEETLRVCQYHIKTLIGDALLTAACICYLGALEQESRVRLLRDWQMVCRGNCEDEDGDDDTPANAESHVDTRFQSTNTPFPFGIHHVPCRSDFSLKQILSSEEELYTWRNSGLSVNSRAVENALTMRAVCDKASRHWPLLIDTDLQSYAWVKWFHENRSNEGGKSSTNTEVNETDENCVLEEEVQILPPVSPCLTTPGLSTHESDEEFSTNYEGSDSTPLTPNQSSRRTSTGACSGLLIREDLARDLNIMTSPVDDTSIDSGSTDFQFDEDEVLIISATDRHRDAKICRAVSSGATVLLIDVERKQLGSKFDNLLARNIFTEKNGKQKVQIGNRCVDYHPAFRLYIYTNMPVELTTTEEMMSLFSNCVVINMALSCEGLQEQLLAEVLALERPEYENERRAFEADVYHHQQQIKNAENDVFERLINMKERLLENSEISKALKQCDELCCAAKQQLEESKALLEISKEKQEDYTHVSEHGAAILLIVSRLSKLHRYYQTPLHIPLKIIHEVVNQRRRGKRSSGSSLARSAELITYMTRAVCSKIANSVYSDHYDVFTFLIAVEKLRLAGQLSEEEWSLFCEVQSHASTNDHSSNEFVDDLIPEWIDLEVWKEVTRLDALPGFQGLKEAILSNSALWKEYFALPPILMAPTPSNIRQLTVFQRALLWKTFKKEKLHMICEDLVLYQLGTNATTVPSFSMESIYHDSTCITPIVFFLPQSMSQENWRKQNLKDPIDEILTLARRLKQDDNLPIINVCEEQSVSTASVVLRTACQRGSWVIMKNCHLASHWPTDVVDIFHKIALNGSKEHITSKHGLFEQERTPYTVTSCIFEQSLVMHPDFRLWLITVPDIGTPLPAVAVRYGIKLAWDDKLSYETSVRQSFLTLWNKHTHSDRTFKQLQLCDVQAESLSKHLASLAIFHSILHQRCKHGSLGFNVPYHWSDRDLLWGYRAACLLNSSVFCACKRTTCPTSALMQNISVLYGGQVLHMFDWESIVALAETHFARPNLQERKPDHVDILFSPSPIVVDMSELGLDECVKSERGILISKKLAMNVSLAYGRTTSSTFCFKPVPYFKKLQDVFQDIKSDVDNAELPSTASQTDESSFQMFLKREIQNYAALLDSVISQLEEIMLGLEGVVSFTSSMHEVAKAITKGLVPQSWCRHSPVCPVLADWTCSLKQQISAIFQYRRCEVTSPLLLDIGVFLNKNSLFLALMSDWSRTSGILPHKLEIISQLQQDPSTMSIPATDGVHMRGFILNNASWNEAKGCLEEMKESGNQSLPSLFLRPGERCETPVDEGSSRNQAYQFDCPVFFYDNLSSRFEPIITLPYVTLPSSLSDHACRQRQVFLTASSI